MLLPNNIYKEIDDIIERSYNGFIYRLMGDEFLSDEQRIQMESLGLLTRRKSLLELLYLLVKQRSERRYQDRRELNELIEGIFQTGVFDQLPRTHQMTIDNALQSMNSIVEKTKAEVSRRVKAEIIKINKEVTGKTPIPTAGPEILSESGKQRNINKLMVAVGVGLLVAHKLFHKEFTGELTDFVNNATADAASGGNLGKDALVYKLVVNDTHLCDWCHKSYVNPDGSPKVYKLKELQRNGTNDGKPRHQWLPVVGPHHPRCRCQLIAVGSDLDEKVVD